MMLDLSDAGARLKVEPGVEVPAEFILVMSRDGRLNRRCRRVWREQETFGVQFVSQDSIKPRHVKKAHGFEIQVPEHAWPDEPAPLETVDAPELVPDPDKAHDAPSR